MSSAISLVIGAVGLLAAVFALIVVLRRSPGREQPAVPASPASGAAGPQTAGPQTAGPQAAGAEAAGVQAAAVEAASAQATAAAQRRLEEAGQEAEQVRSRAETDATAIMREAGLAADKAAQASRDADEELRAARAEARELRADLERREARLAERESRLDGEFGKLEERSGRLDQVRRDLETRRADLDRLDEERRQVLEQAAGLTADQAKAELVAGIQNQAKREAALLVRETENAARRDGEERARRIVTLAIQRVASEQTSESVVSVLHLPGDEMKGRIIGREGRNIRSTRCAARWDGSPWNGSCWTAGSTRSASRKPTSAARGRWSSSACARVRTRWWSCPSPICTPSWSPCSAGCATAPPTARMCCATWSSPRTSPA
jgi:hypothetical protein